MNTPEEASTLSVAFPCRFLRSKEMHYLSPGAEDDEFSSGIYWCNKTHENFGPDGEEVGKRHCCAGRNCYLS